MLLKIDCRENKLIPLVEDLITSYNTTNSNNTITLETGNLNIGDIMIIDDSDKDNYKNLESKVYTLPKEVDLKIAATKLALMGGELEILTEEQINYLNSWEHGTS